MPVMATLFARAGDTPVGAVVFGVVMLVIIIVGLVVLLNAPNSKGNPQEPETTKPQEPAITQEVPVPVAEQPVVKPPAPINVNDLVVAVKCKCGAIFPEHARRCPNEACLTAYQEFQVPERSGFTKIVSPHFIRHAHKWHLPVKVWTVNDPDDMRRLVAWGVDVLITDRPDLAVPIARG